MKFIKPDEVIGPNYLRRWCLFPKNRFFNVYLHHFDQPDPGRDPHDHEYHSLSVLLKGHYTELYEQARSYPNEIESVYQRLRLRVCSQFRVYFRPARQAHTIIEVADKGCWTLFIHGPRFRKWGFHTSDGWTDWESYGDKQK